MSQATKRIMDLAKVDRPREKLVEKGAQALKDEELLAILLRTGYKGKNVIKLAKYLLDEHSLAGLFKMNQEDLIKLKGVGPSKASILKSAFELSKRALEFRDGGRALIENAKDVFAQVSDLANKRQEHLVTLYLNARNELIRKETITIGTIDANLISPREIFSRALSEPVTFVILVHNHPSGDATPSMEDIEITKKLVKAGKIMDIIVFDHVIISESGYTSLRQVKPKIFK